MKKLWDNLSYLGVDNLSISLSDRTLITANRLNVILMLVMLSLFGLTSYFTLINHQSFSFYTTRLVLLVFFCAFNLFLSYKRQFGLMQVLTSLMPVGILIVVPIILGYVQDSSFFYYHLVVFGLSLLPQLVFVPGMKNRWYIFSMVFFFALVYFLDDLMVYYSTSSAKTIDVINHFRIYFKLIPFFVFIFLHVALYYLRRISVEFDDKRVNANEQLKKKIIQLQSTQKKLIQSEKMASLGLLSAGVAHEINNPLNFIKGGVKGLVIQLEKLEIGIDTHLKTCTDIIEEGVSRISRIVLSMGHFSRSGSDMEEDCDLQSILDNCLTIIQHSIKNRVEVKKKYLDKPLQVKGNDGKLHQAFLNILTNAEQSIKEKGSIRLELKQETDKVLVEIEDNGIGMDDLILNKIMDPFFTTKNPGEGTGLGLSITYQIIKEHLGTIDIKSVKGNGTTLLVTLPISS